MKTAKLVFWIRTPSDSRFTASDTATINVPQGIAVRLAQSIESVGQGAFTNGDAQYIPTLRPGFAAASGHGVLILYASGRKRLIEN